MPGNGSAPSEGDRLKVLAENAGIPELQAFEEDSGKLEATQDEVRAQLDAADNANELLDDPFFKDKDEKEVDDLTDENLQIKKTLH